MVPLLEELIATRHGAGVVGRAGPSRWLLPGHSPRRPIGHQRLCQRLAIYGLQARRSRNSALADLAADMPAVLLSRLLGMSIESAASWSHHIAASRADYAAQRSRRSRNRIEATPASRNSAD